MAHPVYGQCWWDFDETGILGIECEHPPGDAHYLLKFLHRPLLVDSNDLLEAATLIVDALNGGGFVLAARPTRKPAGRPGWKSNDLAFTKSKEVVYHPQGDGVDATFSLKGKRKKHRRDE